MVEAYGAALWSWVAIIIGVIGYGWYFKDVAASEIKPNRWSWLIWSAATLIEAFTFDAVSGDFFKSSIFFASAICCWMITLLIWSRSVWAWPDWTELGCVAFSVVSLVVWLVYSEALWAHLLMVVALPVAFVPTWRSAYRSPGHEMSPAWAIWSIGDLIALSQVVMRLNGWEELPFILMEFACHFSIWLTVTWRARVVPATRGGS